MTVINKANIEKFQNILIQKAVLSYPNLIEKSPIDGKYIKKEEDRHYNATFVLDKTITNSDGEVIPNPVVENLKQKIAELQSIYKIKRLKYEVFKDGDEIYEDEEDEKKKKNKEYLRGKYTVKARNNREVQLFVKVNGKATLTSEVDNINNSDLFYGGAIVNAHIELVTYPYKEGEKKEGISLRLHSLQFSQHGTKFSKNTDTPRVDASVKSASMFSSIKDDEEDSDFAPTSKFDVEDEPF